MTGLAQLQRQALATTLSSVGADAPTLCEGWRTKDLAVHLVLRERRPDVAAGSLVPALAERAQAVRAEYAAHTWEDLVDMVRQGPAGWSPTRVPAVDDAINLAEFYVHREDVLRAAPDWTPEQILPLRPDLQNALWNRLKQAGQLLFRRSPVGVVLDPTLPSGAVEPGTPVPEWGTRSVHGPTKLGTVTLSGPPGELVLFGFGRGQVAQVHLDGDPDAVAALRGARLSV